MKKSIKEGSMSDIDVMAKEAVSFKDFVKEFYKEFRDFPKNREAMKWLEDTYKSVSEGVESDDLERVADGLPQTVEETINEISLSSAGVRDFLRALYRDNKIVKKLGFANFKGVVDYIRGSGGRDWDELRDEATAFGLQFESIKEGAGCGCGCGCGGSTLKENTEPSIISQLKDIVKHNQSKVLVDPKSGKKMRVDLFSASAMTQVYDGLKQQSNKDKFVGSGLIGMQSMAMKLLK